MAKPRDFLVGIYMKLKSEYETEVYVSNAGYFCIKQDNPASGKDTLVMLSPKQMAAIALYWNKTKKETSEIFSKPDVEDE